MNDTNLLDVPMFTVVGPGGASTLRTLPEVLEDLGHDRVGSFGGLRAHQEHPWYAFLTQLAAIILGESAQEVTGLTSIEWRDKLLSLTQGSSEPWTLVVEDLSSPAFLQPPIPERSLEKLRTRYTTPDEMDVVITSKNHDVKTTRLTRPRLEYWIYALICLQTTQGFLGKGNYGISRMKGGFGNRPGVAFVSSLRPGLRFCADVQAMGITRNDVIDKYEYQESGGIGLLWMEPWDGTLSLARTSLDPWYIEICRRVRCVRGLDNTITTHAGSTDTIRVQKVEGDPATGDPWAPVEKEANAVLTVSFNGFDYKLLHRLLLSGDFELPAPMEEVKGRRIMVANALVRGQGTTEGFHERTMLLPKELMEGKATPWIQHARGLAKSQLEAADKARKVLYSALRKLLDAGSEGGGRADARPDRWTGAFTAAIDQQFFATLWSDMTGVDSEDWPNKAHRSWEKFIYEAARTQLNRAIDSVPYPSVRRYKAITAAEGVFEGSFRKNFPDLKVETTHEPR